MALAVGRLLTDSDALEEESSSLLSTPQGGRAVLSSSCEASGCRSWVPWLSWKEQGAPSQEIPQPPMQVLQQPPREWPMARLCISCKQVNKCVRTEVWRRVADLGLRGTHSDKSRTSECLVGDLLVVSNALAAPLANLGKVSPKRPVRVSHRQEWVRTIFHWNHCAEAWHY